MIMLPLFMECVCIPDPTPVVFTHLWPDKKKKENTQKENISTFFWTIGSCSCSFPSYNVNLQQQQQLYVCCTVFTFFLCPVVITQIVVIVL